MNRITTAAAVAVALAFGAPAIAQQQTQKSQQSQQQGSKQAQKQGIVSATGKVTGDAELKTSAGDLHRLVKLQKGDGKEVVVDLGVGGPVVQKGDRLFVTGHSARINNKPVIFARYAAELQEVGRAGQKEQQASGAQDSASAGGTAAGEAQLWTDSWNDDQYGLFNENMNWTADDSGFTDFYGDADDAWGSYYDDAGDEGLFDI